MTIFEMFDVVSSLGETASIRRRFLIHALSHHGKGILNIVAVVNRVFSRYNGKRIIRVFPIKKPCYANSNILSPPPACLADNDDVIPCPSMAKCVGGEIVSCDGLHELVDGTCVLNESSNVTVAPATGVRATES